jgi:hypothetical protein
MRAPVADGVASIAHVSPRVAQAQEQGQEPGQGQGPAGYAAMAGSACWAARIVRVVQVPRQIVIRQICPRRVVFSPIRSAVARREEQAQVLEPALDQELERRVIRPAAKHVQKYHPRVYVHAVRLSVMEGHVK